ncbi:MAG: hypothetical protein U9P14_09775 [Gemmatimonadota bacterium]|nr:hypothetical protein [Gemmatimonadota bacterium]
MPRTNKRSYRTILLPPAYRRWPVLGGVAAGLWLLVLFYIVRMLVFLWQGNGKTAVFSLAWSILCLLLWTLLHRWAQRRQA